MIKPSSRTPEGIPHTCLICGHSFKVLTSPAGDACCPKCNSLIWPGGFAESLGQHDGDFETEEVFVEAEILRIRFRLHSSEEEIDFKTARAIQGLENEQYVEIQIKFRGREFRRKEEGQKILDRLVEALVPEHGRVLSREKRLIRSRRRDTAGEQARRKRRRKQLESRKRSNSLICTIAPLS